ncbi:MAG TPA: RusA family crossover junction endodeoxyribonuclease, partial [Ferruginibacter sp.]|nr:RusA family crossover junction endodeoxyribonuclease [Ferruginibacter sp.]
MNFDIAFIDMTNVEIVLQEKGGSLFLKILPITYSDNKRNPRLPRKASKQTNLQKDTNHIFQHAFSSLKTTLDSVGRYKIDIKVYKSNDKLGGGDLDNYCKAILDGITSTRMIWVDDKQVDEIGIKRYFITDSEYSYIE